MSAAARPPSDVHAGPPIGEGFPALAARTQRFTLGRPRSFAAGSGRVAFLRSAGGSDPVTSLWCWSEGGGEVRVADPTVLGADDSDLPPEERARRERVRETAQGITTYAVDDQLGVAAFGLAGRLGVADLTGARPARLLAVEGPVADPRPSPDGRHLGWVAGDRLLLGDTDGAVRRVVAGPAGTHCGLPDFIASEELGRYRGWWWSPDSSMVLAAVVDDSPVQRWWISDPSQPDREAVEQRYPAAGTPNAVVSLLLADVDGGAARPVTGWDPGAFPYLARVSWTTGGLCLQVLARDQRSAQVLVVDPATGVAELRRELTDPTWVELIDGVPRLLDDGRLLHTVDDAEADHRRLAIDGEALSAPWLHVDSVRHVGAGAVLVRGSADDPTIRDLYVVSIAGGQTWRLTGGNGVYDGVAGDDLLVVVGATLDAPGAVAEVRRANAPLATLSSLAEIPPLRARPRLVQGGERDLRVAILLPTGHRKGSKLPVLMDPYGGPHHSEVLAAHNGWLEPQWLADQGFAVVVCDGRGTPGRSLSWEKSIAGDLATFPLQDQVDALAVAAANEPALDLTRVAIRGWSFGGYLAALAVLRRPDVFHAAIAGAPVVDWRLYDTGYTERYLGTHPEGADRAAYDGSSLLPHAPGLSRQLLIIHGLADDNVVAAHTLRLSGALLAHGRPHDVLPLSAVTHVSGGVADGLLRLQLAWLHRALR